jgi:hypothetical protein
MRLSAKEQYLLDHSCPYWADEKQWQELLDRVVFLPNDGISFEKLSVKELRILDGFSFGDALMQRNIHHNERKALLDYLRYVGRKFAPSTKLVKRLWTENPNAKPSEVYVLIQENDSKLFNSLSSERWKNLISEHRPRSK